MRPRQRTEHPAPPRHRRILGFVCLALVVWLGAARTAAADEPQLEFWPEIDTWLRFSPAWRMSLFTALSKNIETAYREGSLILQADYAWGKGKKPNKRRLLDESRAVEMRRFMVRVGYLSGASLADQGDEYRERTALVELHLRTPLRGNFLVTHRLRTDLRWIGQQPDFSARIRYRLMVEKEFMVGRTSLVPYGNVEFYYDTRYSVVNRIRAIGGATVLLSRYVGLEGNLTYQHDSRSSVTNIWAVNAILHLFFETGGAK
jgi:Protein of unknown function (DUF2490)